MENRASAAKRQLFIFLGVTFALPFALGILMGYGYSRGLDMTAFPTAQMFYPAAGAILAILLTRKGDRLIPKRYFTGILIAALLLIFCVLASILIPALPWSVISQFVIIFASLAAWVLLLTEEKDKRIAYGLKGGQWKAAAAIVLLYLLLYFGRTGILCLMNGEAQFILDVIKDSRTWVSLAVLPLNYFLVFTAFWGEEYGWRYYLQPILQKKLGMARGVLVLGLVWGIWHLPINFFYYASPSDGLISLTGQFITCIALGIFYGWAYMKTDNIWTVVILHYLNNNLIPVISGTYTADVLQNQDVAWDDIVQLLVVNGILFMGFLFSKYYKDRANRLPTMDERADKRRQALLAAAEAPGPEQG